MDSSDLEKEMNADNSSLITPSKRDIFLSTYRRQRFTLPNSMIHYIAKNPKNSDVYQKMIKRCKYFFIKNPILVVSYLSYSRNGWETYVNETWKNIDMNTISFKLWITYDLYVFSENISNNSIASSIIPNIYQCDVKYLRLFDQVISLNKFIFLCSSADGLTLHKVTVKNDDGTVVSFDKLFEQLTNVKIISYTFSTPSNNTSKNTFKELWKIPHFSKYDSFTLSNIPEDFDIDSFYSFMKKNNNTRLNLRFSDAVSEEHKARLETIIDEIIETKNRKYKSPYFEFPGLDEEKLLKLNIIFRG